ncbi:putative glutathione S-transferase [Shewanella sediminis HAW-EB3]|uniref:Putative glutathione S-transferase n=1 Tax=Shewanella sediminis (strain HAW-EB3) TaxID=425104 RepID=A8FZT4_SHESH|nr:glutathione S-transferase [Shewanella sediminis]ABV38357.1 putative glutathione S-transferase [Shewanella sediminis HAW-EB3]
MSPPILYSLRRCPYTMRARLAILLSKQTVILREIVLKNIPPQMLAVSKHARVPLLVFDDGTVIEESLDIMLWALAQNDPSDLLLSSQVDALPAMLALIDRNDNVFVPALEQYKAAARYHDTAQEHYLDQCQPFISHLEQRLDEHLFLMGMTPSLVDYALLPFVRQFSRVNHRGYLQSPHKNVRRWMNSHYEQPIFSKAMTPCPLWLDNQDIVLFGGQ